MTALPEAPEPRFDLFVSYAHVDDDDGWVRSLVDELRDGPDPLRVAVFFDRDAIRTRQDWELRLLQGLRDSCLLLVIASPSYFASTVCGWEWDEFGRREAHWQLAGDGIVIVYAADDEFDKPTAPPLDGRRKDLGRRQYLDARPFRKAGPEGWASEAGWGLLAEIRATTAAAHARRRRAARSPVVGFTPHPTFVGRVAELRAVHSHLLGDSPTLTAILGLGGSGKSSLAVAYAHAWADAYPGGRFVVPCGGATELDGPLAALAVPLGVPASDPRSTAALVVDRLRKGERKLLILDNVDDAAMVGPTARATYLPADETLRILITSREEARAFADSPTNPSVQCLPLDELTEDDGVALLNAYRPLRTDEDREAARWIVRRLNGHALACEIVAVSLMQHPTVSVAEHRADLERQGLFVLDELSKDRLTVTRHRETNVARLLAPTLTRLRGESIRAWRVLGVAAYAEPDVILAGVLRREAGLRFHWGAAVIPLRSASDRQWNELAARLVGLRLLAPLDADRSAFRMHRLVQHAVRARLWWFERQRSRMRLRQCHVEEVDRYLDAVAAWNAPADEKTARCLAVLDPMIGTVGKNIRTMALTALLAPPATLAALAGVVLCLGGPWPASTAFVEVYLIMAALCAVIALPAIAGQFGQYLSLRARRGLVQRMPAGAVPSAFGRAVDHRLQWFVGGCAVALAQVSRAVALHLTDKVDLLPSADELWRLAAADVTAVAVVVGVARLLLRRTRTRFFATAWIAFGIALAIPATLRSLGL